MTVRGLPARERHLRPLPPGDPGRITPVTRIIWADERDMPEGRNAMASIAEDGTTVIVVREGLAAAVQQGEIAKIRGELHHLGAGRMSAWAIITAEGVRQIGWRWLWTRAAQTAGAHLIPTIGGTALAIGAATTAVIAASSSDAPAPGSPAWHHLHPVHVSLAERPLSYLGAFEQSSPGSYAGMDTFAATCGRQPNVALYYSGWYQPFALGFAQQAARHGAIPLVQINPRIGTSGPGISLGDIAAGRYDSYLVSFADDVASYHKAVIVGFGHEMNGSWYPWGWNHKTNPQSPGEFVAAWRHIVNVFRYQGADNVTWLWTVNQQGAGTAPLASYWPGRGYVTWVGIDGYYRHPDDTWSNVFAPTIDSIRAIPEALHTPLLISETAIGPAGTEPWQLSDMYASIRQNNYLGMVWFDKDKPGEPYRLEDNLQSKITQQIIAVFRQETLSWRLEHQHGPRKASGKT